MQSDTELLKKRFIELANKSYNAGIYTFTDFLGLSEQSAFTEILRELKGIPYTAFGGAEGAERVIIRFGSEQICGYDADFPISIIKIEPEDQRFADRLTHRDFLGAILNLGIERDTLGDIVIIDNVGYLFAKEDIAPYVIDSLTRVRHTQVRLSYIESIPDGQLYRTEIRTVQVSSERLDAIVARVFSLSREDSQMLFAKGLVFANGRQIQSSSYQPKENEKISVRGHGRFIYVGPRSLSRKGKVNVEIEKYI